MNAIELLVHDHETVKKLLNELSETTERALKKRSELLGRLELELVLHTAIEEDILYPAIRDSGGKEELKMYYEAKEEHRTVDSPGPSRPQAHPPGHRAVRRPGQGAQGTPGAPHRGGGGRAVPARPAIARRRRPQATRPGHAAAQERAEGAPGKTGGLRHARRRPRLARGTPAGTWPRWPGRRGQGHLPAGTRGLLRRGRQRCRRQPGRAHQPAAPAARAGAAGRGAAARAPSTRSP